MLKLDLVTIFPAMLEAPLADGIVGRAREAGLVSLGVHDLRAFSDDKHRTTDDAAFGGGPGMVMKAEPFFRAVESLLPQGPGAHDAVVLLSPRGRRFDQATAARYAGLERLVLLCGRYEGIDERVAEHLGTAEFSIGDFILSGGEIAAALIVDAVARYVPGVVGKEESVLRDSFSDPAALETVVEHPHYTRPAEFRGWPVPPVLISGDHEAIRKWRTEAALEKTARNRPDLLK